MQVRDQILLALLKSGEPVSGEKLSETLGITRAAVWKHIQALREEGYVFSSLQNVGHRLESVPDALIGARVFALLNTRELGRNPVCFAEVDSTNTQAKQLAAQGAPHGTLVLAQRQTAGRGRMGRQWIDEPNANIAMSLLLRPPVAPEEAPKLTLLAALAVRRAFEHVCGLRCAIKWPNDLLFGEKKVCGILTEMSANMDQLEYAVVGIGVNANNTTFAGEIAEIATSLFLQSGQKTDRNALIAAVVNEMEGLIDDWLSGGFGALLTEYRAHCASLNRTVRVRSIVGETTGFAEDIDESGRILIRTADGTLLCVASGEVSLRNEYND